MKQQGLTKKQLKKVQGGFSVFEDCNRNDIDTSILNDGDVCIDIDGCIYGWYKGQWILNFDTNEPIDEVVTGF